MLIWTSSLPPIKEHNQFCEQIKASTIWGVNELGNGSRIRPLVLKSNLEATVKIGIASTSLAISGKIGYLGQSFFHQLKILNLSLHAFLLGSTNYTSTSLFPRVSFFLFFSFKSFFRIISIFLWLISSHIHIYITWQDTRSRRVQGMITVINRYQLNFDACYHCFNLVSYKDSKQNKTNSNL